MGEIRQMAPPVMHVSSQGRWIVTGLDLVNIVLISYFNYSLHLMFVSS